jgi:hypothetical protein
LHKNNYYVFAVLWRTPNFVLSPLRLSGVKKKALSTSVVENSFSGVLRSVLRSGESAFFTPEKETGAESLKAPESVSGVLRVF